MKNSDKKVNIRAFRDVKKQYLGGGGGGGITNLREKHAGSESSNDILYKAMIMMT